MVCSQCDEGTFWKLLVSSQELGQIIWVVRSNMPGSTVLMRLQWQTWLGGQGLNPADISEEREKPYRPALIPFSFHALSPVLWL